MISSIISFPTPDSTYFYREIFIPHRSVIPFKSCFQASATGFNCFVSVNFTWLIIFQKNTTSLIEPQFVERKERSSWCLTHLSTTCSRGALIVVQCPSCVIDIYLVDTLDATFLAQST